MNPKFAIFWTVALSRRHCIRVTKNFQARHKSWMRRGETVVRGWKVGDSATKNMVKQGRQLEARDLVPNIQQKGVDLRIGLDIALISLRRLAQTLVIVSADSDLVPAFKLARREGVRVFLDHLRAPRSSGAKSSCRCGALTSQAENSLHNKNKCATTFCPYKTIL